MALELLEHYSSCRVYKKWCAVGFRWGKRIENRERLENSENVALVSLCPITDPRVVDSVRSIDPIVLEECCIEAVGEDP